MRLPLAVSLESRDGGVTKDCIVKNGIVESRGQDVPPILRKRPGNLDLGLVLSGTAQALAYWNGTTVAVIGDNLNIGIVGSGATWNASDKGSGITLSGGNLVATTASTTGHSVRANVGKTTGKWYWEITATTVTIDFTAGVANGSASVTAALGQDTNSTIANGVSGRIVYNAGIVDSNFAPVTGDVMGFALDCDGRTLKFYINNVLKSTITGSSLPTGTLHPAVGGNGNAGVTVYTANFGASSFTYTAPTGYSRLTQTAAVWTGNSSTALNPSIAGLQFSLQDNGSNSPSSQLMIKNASQAWTLTSGGTLAAISDVDYPGTYAVTLTSLTRSGTTATATTAVDTNFQVGSSVTIAGAGQADYNGAKVITGVTASSTVASPDVSITITRSSTTATATTVSEPHGFTNGQTVTISGSDQAEYNGAHVITWISATSFSFTVTVTTGTTSPATGTTIGYQPDGIGATGSFSGATATITMPSHGFSTGAVLNIVTAGLAVVCLAGTATVVDANTFTVSITANQAYLDGLGISAVVVRPVSATVSTLTSSNGTATLTTGTAHNLTSGRYVQVFGANQAAYNMGNVAVVVTSTTSFTYQLVASAADSPITPATGTITANGGGTPVGASFTFTVANSPVTPATGTITATGGRNTVPGIVYLDGRFYVMDIYGVIYESDEDAPGSWQALEYVIAQAETGAGKAIARSLNYIVALKEWSAELWYDAGLEPPGATIAQVGDGLMLVGCASGDSVVKAGEGLLFWLSQTKERGRSVHVMQGRNPSKISTPDVDRILDADDLATVRATSLKIGGHQLYLLTLETSNITLCYDMQSQAWTQWSSYTAGSTVSVSSITRSGTTATVTTSGVHGLSDGDPVLMAGANQSDYNGIFQAYVTSTTVFTIEVANSPVTPATGTITAAPYTESYFKFTKYCDANGLDVMLHESNGHLYQVLSTLSQDAGIPINRFVRTTRLDGGSEDFKVMAVARLIGDSGTGTPAIRWSDNDSATFASYRKIDMSNQKPETRRCGKFRRRSLEVRDVGNTAERWEALELDIGGQ